MVMDALPRGLCHYTNGQGFLGIVGSREFWATHIYYLNDHTEYQYAYERTQGLIERITVLRELAAQAPELHSAIMGGLRPYRRGRPVAIFVVSLTENWDDLSQWRGYTSPGD